MVLRKESIEGKYTYLDHEVGVMVKSRGGSLDHAYENMGLALCDMVIDRSSLDSAETKSIRVEAESITACLKSYLTHLLDLLCKDHFFISDIYFLAITQTDAGFLLTAKIDGVTDPSLAHHTKPREVTYTQMSLELLELQKVYEVTVVFAE